MVNQNGVKSSLYILVPLIQESAIRFENISRTVFVIALLSHFFLFFFSLFIPTSTFLVSLMDYGPGHFSAEMDFHKGRHSRLCHDRVYSIPFSVSLYLRSAKMFVNRCKVWEGLREYPAGWTRHPIVHHGRYISRFFFTILLDHLLYFLRPPPPTFHSSFLLFVLFLVSQLVLMPLVSFFILFFLLLSCFFFFFFFFIIGISHFG